MADSSGDESEGGPSETDEQVSEPSNGDSNPDDSPDESVDDDEPAALIEEAESDHTETAEDDVETTGRGEDST